MVDGITISIEGKRGCGRRKPGGYYLVSASTGSPCHKLPWELKVCAACGQGWAPARGWSWVDTSMWTPEGDASGRALADAMGGCGAPGCSDCPLGGAQGRHGMLWVGSGHYKTPEEFMAEAREMGVSRRLNSVPRDFKVGTHWVLLAHREVIAQECGECGGSGTIPPAQGSDAKPEKCKRCKGTGKVWLPAVFSAFKPTAVEYVVTGEEDEEQLERLQKRGITPVQVVPDDEATREQWEAADVCRGCVAPWLKEDTVDPVDETEAALDAGLIDPDPGLASQVAHAGVDAAARQQAAPLSEDEVAAVDEALALPGGELPEDPEVDEECAAIALQEAEQLEADKALAMPEERENEDDLVHITTDPNCPNQAPTFCGHYGKATISASALLGGWGLNPDLNDEVCPACEAQLKAHKAEQRQAAEAETAQGAAQGADDTVESDEQADGPPAEETAQETADSAASDEDALGIPEAHRPECQLVGTDGNIFALLGKARVTLRKTGYAVKAKEMSDRVTAAGSYDEALAIICQYVDPS